MNIRSLRDNLLVELLINTDSVNGASLNTRLFWNVKKHRGIILLYLGSQLFTIKHLLDEHVYNLLYILISPILWIVGIIFMFPLIKRSISLKNNITKKNGSRNMSKLFGILFKGTTTENPEESVSSDEMFQNSINADKVKRTSNCPLNANILLANVLTVILTFLFGILWYLFVLRFSDIYLEFAAVFYMILWSLALSVVTFTGMLSWSIYGIFREHSLKDYQISKWIMREVLRDEVSFKLKTFKEELIDPLKSLFSIPLSVALRTLIVFGIATFALSLIEHMGSHIPKHEISQFQYTLVLLALSSLIILSMFSYIIVRMSIKLRSILLLELRETKLQLVNTPTVVSGDNTKLPFEKFVLEEMEKMLDEDELLFLSSRNLGEIIASVIVILANVGVFLLNL